MPPQRDPATGLFLRGPRPSPDPPPLPDAETVEKVTKETAARVAAAQDRRRRFIGAINGAKLRVGVLEAEFAQGKEDDAEGLSLAALAAQLGVAVADWAMIQVLNERVELKDAKQAMDVAKIGLDIHDRMTGTAGPDLANLSPEERDAHHKALRAGVATLAMTLKRRASEMEAQGFGDSDDQAVGGAAPDASDAPEGEEPGGSLASVTPLTIVPDQSEPPVQED